MCRSRSCVPSSKTLARRAKLSREWVRAFLVSIDLSFKAAAQRSGPNVWTLPDEVVLSKRFIMKVAFLLDEWSLYWTRTFNFDETCLCLSPIGSHGWRWKDANEKLEFQRPFKQAVTVTLVTSAVRAQVAAQCIFHGTTERVVPDFATEVWMTCSHNHWVSTETLRQLFSKMEGMVDEHTPGQDFAVIMDMAPIHISAETKQMLQEEFGHIRVIMIPPHTTSFLQPCDVGLMRPFKSTIRRTACENYAKAIYNNTDDIGIVQPTAVPDLRANLDSSRLEFAHWSATEASSSHGSTCEALMRCGARCSMKHAKCMQLGRSRMCGRNRRCQRRWSCLPSPKSTIWTIMRVTPPRNSQKTSRRITRWNGSNHLWKLQWEHLRNECRISSLFAWCGVRPRPVTSDKPRHAAKNGCDFRPTCLFTNVFSEFLVASSGSHGSSSSSVLESLLELTDATVMMNNEPTDTLHRIWQSFPRCLCAT